MSAENPKKTSFRFRSELLARALPADVLEPAACAVLNATPGNSAEKIAVACSGGADSVAALLLAWEHFPLLRGKFVVLNFNHGTRPECAAEARFVKKIAGELGEKFVGGKVGASLAKPASALEVRCRRVSPKMSGVLSPWRASRATPLLSEDALRRQRLEFFREAMREHNCRILVQGHHAGDVVETMLMRLARGSGTGGLCAPRPVQKFQDGKFFVRPLLLIEKEKIIAALRESGISWCEDASNAGGDYLRNRLRNSAVPAWMKAQGVSPAVGVLRSRMLLEEDDAALEAWADCISDAGALGFAARARVPAPRNLPRAVWRRLLWRFLVGENLADNISAPLADEIVESLAGGKSGKWSAGDAFLIFDGEALRIENANDAGAAAASPASYEIALPDNIETKPEGRAPRGRSRIAEIPRSRRARRSIPIRQSHLTVSEKFEISAELISLSEKKLKEIIVGKIPPATEVFLNAGAIAGKKLFVRAWLAGDSYRPLGAPGARKLSDIFIDKKIPVKLRRRLPVICDADGIVWVPGLPPVHRCRLTGIENLALRLTHVPKNAFFFGSK